MSNDNVNAQDNHHKLCIATLQNLRDAMDAAIKLGAEVNLPEEAEDFMNLIFWRDKIDFTLRKPVMGELDYIIGDGIDMKTFSHSLRGHSLPQG